MKFINWRCEKKKKRRVRIEKFVMRFVFFSKTKISTRFINSTTRTGLVWKKIQSSRTCFYMSRPRTSRYDQSLFALHSNTSTGSPRPFPLSSGDKFWISGIHSRIAPVNLLPGLNFEDSKREQWKFVPALDDQINLSWKISNFSYFWQKKKQHHLYIDATIIPYHIFIIQFQEYTTTKRKE